VASFVFEIPLCSGVKREVVIKSVDQVPLIALSCPNFETRDHSFTLNLSIIKPFHIVNQNVRSGDNKPQDFS